jgi:2-oxoglutarate ferredoxin oxidoreductase subunit alpha
MGYEFIEGNEAVARGAMQAGCDFFAGYPITPASSILHYMLELIPKVDGIAIQAEDEIASIGFCIGAAMAGRTVMTATSGPGISLYSENLGLAAIGETPMVIVNVQRQGPATGSATKGAEGDIQFTRWGTSGGLPVIALSPTSVAEAYELTYHAFNFAERFRVPVTLLSSKEIGLTRERVDLDAIKLSPRVERTRAAANEHFVPHGFQSPDEVPAMADMGGAHIVRYTTSTHDQVANLTTNPEIIGEMLTHYNDKIMNNIDEITLVKEDLEIGADTLFISYGITSRSVAVAVETVRRKGRKISSLVLQTLWPVPEKAILAAMQGVKKVIVPEMNLGQYLLEVQRLAPADVELVGINKMNTTLISPAQILEEGGLL